MDFMLDIETLSSRVTAATVQIGVVEFDPHSVRIGNGLQINIDLADAMKYGHCDGDTLAWWFGQKPEVVESVFGVTAGARVPLKVGLEQLEAWLRDHAEDEFRIWADPSEFDHAVIANACWQTGAPRPWPRRATRDMRTWKEWAWTLVERAPAPADVGVGTHNALSDAIWQAKCLQQINFQLECLSKKTIAEGRA